MHARLLYADKSFLLTYLLAYLNNNHKNSTVDEEMPDKMLRRLL